MGTTFTIHTELPSGLPVTVEFNYVPGRPARMYLRNGDPGYPADPEDYEIVAVRVRARNWRGEEAEYDIMSELGQRFFDDGGEVMDACKAHIASLDDDCDMGSAA